MSYTARDNNHLIEFPAAYEEAIQGRIAEGARRKWVAFCEARPEIDWEAVQRGNEFLRGLWESGIKYGKLSDKQVECVIKAQAAREEREAAREAAREAERAALLESGVEVPMGRNTVRGEVLAVKEYENDYGVTSKLLVRDDRGFKVWVTSPTIKVACDHEERCRNRYEDSKGNIYHETQAEKGDFIEFSANLEPSGDPLFAKASRPTKAALVALALPAPEPEEVN